MFSIGDIVHWKDGSGILRKVWSVACKTYCKVEKADGSIVKLPISVLYLP